MKTIHKALEQFKEEVKELDQADPVRIHSVILEGKFNNLYAYAISYETNNIVNARKQIVVAEEMK